MFTVSDGPPKFLVIFLSDRGDRRIFGSNKEPFDRPQGSFRMGAGGQKDQALMRSLKLSAPLEASGLQVEFIIDHVCELRSP